MLTTLCLVRGFRASTPLSRVIEHDVLLMLSREPEDCADLLVRDAASR
jgi:hypothetical protein